MKKFILVFVMLAFAGIASAKPDSKTYDFAITRVIDGDTVEFKSDFLPLPLKQVLSIRVFGVDTPEKGFRADCDSEAAKGLAASEFTKKQIAEANKLQVVIMDWDKFGGRVLGDILVDGKSLRGMLIAKGYAREYYGDKKKSWCQ